MVGYDNTWGEAKRSKKEVRAPRSRSTAAAPDREPHTKKRVDQAHHEIEKGEKASDQATTSLVFVSARQGEASADGLLVRVVPPLRITVSKNVSVSGTSA